MKTIEAKKVWDGRALLGEGPFWDEHEQRLLWVDIDGYKLHSYDPVRENLDTLPFAQHVTAVVKTDHGGFVLAMRDGLYRYVGDRLTPLFLLPDGGEAVRFNDAKCDPQGRLWAGTMAFNGKDNIGMLYLLDEDGTIHEEVKDLTISNGMAWDESKHLFYHNETTSSTTTIYRYEAGDTRNITAVGAVPITYSDYGGSPDGMTIDKEGMLWVALWGAGAVIRVKPTTGEVIETVTVPASHTTSCTFGGEDYQTLFITTAAKENEADSGGLFTAKVNVKGVRSHSYKSYD
ncbi:SMP-30/gluconolactonase/LRE family protein [Shouchella sp. JSM 1781072]|uniref:SMP-30/gluconolactonase/LRE family protein n=1 Tax=Shouchella sp. JSM 1781072 TaxID=3344581 RepID=UPI0035C2395B